MRRFWRLVRDMRQAQIRYFAERKREDLIESKRLEGLVDQMLKLILREHEHESEGKPQ
jgi:hypothetical protein